jgi:competence ComEA-like helix-hairpin-helix protein
VVHTHPLSSPLTCALFLLTAGLSACQPDSPQILRPAPLPQDDQIQVYMNHEPASSYTEPYRQITRNGDNLEQLIIDAIASARSTVDVAVQEFRLPGIAQALVERQQAGVRVRVIMENTYSRPYSQFTPEEVARLPERERDRYAEARRLIDLNNDGQLSQDEITQRDGLVILDKAQIPRIDDTADGSAGSNLMHHKFVVVDNRTIIITSANFTTSDVHGDFKTPLSRGNANNLLKINSPEMAAAFTEEFNLMWGDRANGRSRLFGVKKPFRPARQFTVGASQVEVQFSPFSRSTPWSQTTNGLIGKTLAGADQAIAMALFVFSDQTLVNRLEPLHRQGVAFKTLIDPGFAYRSYSEGLDMMGVALAEECKVEPDNRPWQPAIATVGVPRMPPGDLLHHKFGLIDGKTVVTGSHNWTEAANRGNDETVVVVHNPIVAAHYQREFERLYSNAILGVPPAIQKKAAAQTRQCPTLTSSQKAKGEPILAPIASQAQPVPAKPQRNPRQPESARLKEAIHPKQRTGRVNLNTATQAELERLPGVGPSLARRIIAARQKKPFTSLADFDQLSGVGPKLLEKLKAQISW